MDFEYLWEELEISLKPQEIDNLIRLLNLDKIDEAKKVIAPILEDTEDINFVIEEFIKIREREMELSPCTREQVLKDLENEEINVYVVNIFGHVEKVIFLNLGTKENPKIRFFVGNEILDFNLIKQIWKPKYFKN